MRQFFRLILVLMVAYYVTKWWLDQQEKQSLATAKVISPLKSPPSNTAPKQSSDPLIELDGIGPAYERALNAMGIYTFAQLAVQNPDNLAEHLASVRVTAARIKRDQWIEQAAARANLPVPTSSRWSANDGNSA